MSNLSIDFDATIHSYTSGYSKNKFDPPVPGAIEALSKLSEKYDTIYIFTARTGAELDNVETWMKYQFETAGMDYPTNIEYTNTKPVADVYVDDRGYQFKGDWTKTLNDIETYKIWMNEHRLPSFMESYENRYR